MNAGFPEQGAVRGTTLYFVRRTLVSQSFMKKIEWLRLVNEGLTFAIILCIFGERFTTTNNFSPTLEKIIGENY